MKEQLHQTMNVKLRKGQDNSMDLEDLEEAENLGAEDEADREADDFENNAYKKLNTQIQMIRKRT